jgi:hypothetical protein
MKHQAQRIRELEAEILVLQLCCNDVARAMSAQERASELWSTYVRLIEKCRAAIVEWHRLSDPQAAMH